MAFAAHAPLLGGCAVVDGFSSRARDYNSETSNTKTGTVILNIVRSAYAEPLQFTDISSLSGQSAINASLGGGVPFPFRGGASAALPQQFINVNPSVGGSVNNTFGVANLNTQEFYNGLQSPVSTQLIASYMSAGFDPKVLFTLVMSEIEITRGGQRFILRNTPLSPDNFAAFYQAMAFLVEAGISAERVSDMTQVGPTLTVEEARDPRLLAAVVTSTSSDAPSLSKVPNGEGFGLSKRNAEYRFCFDRARSERARRRIGNVEFFAAPMSGSGEVVSLALSNLRPVPSFSFQLHAGDYCGASADARKASRGLDRVLKMKPRSVQGIFGYLGEMTRGQLGLAGDPEVDLAVRSDNYPRDLFRIGRGAAGAYDYAITHRGEIYGVNVDPSGKTDRSSRVLQFLTELLALQSSAKNLPAPNLITVIGQ